MIWAEQDDWGDSYFQAKAFELFLMNSLVLY